jgi:[ribosomal protein S5]-alanine N-acetyltransferase
VDVLTDRLVLRRPVPGDEARYRDLLFNPEVEAWLRPSPLRPFSESDPPALLARDLEHWGGHGFGPRVVEERGGDGSVPFAGRAGLSWTTVEGVLAVQLAWALVPRAQRRGLATEAALALVDEARALALPEVVSFTLPHNTASRRVMEKAGMEEDGDIVHAGLPHVLYRLALG